MRGLCCLGVVHAAVCWGRLRSAGGTNAAPTTCAMVFLRGGCEARHQRRRAGGGGPGGDKAASGRGSGPSSGPLRRSARCCAHSCSTLTRPHRRSFSPTTASGPRGVRSAPRLSLWGPQGARRSRRTRPLRRRAPGPGARSTRGATSSSRTRRATSAGASCPGSLRAPRVARVDASDAARVAHLLETTPKTRPRTRAARARPRRRAGL